jgi:orotate phosphoribosyltransferase
MAGPSLASRIDRVARVEGSFTLRSGAVTHEYFDKYQFESRPDLLEEIARELVDLVPPGTELLGGLELGGVPVATALALASGLPAAFVRKRAKAYGTARLAEGPPVAGRTVLVVEDVVTSGGQVARSTTDLRALGATVTDALCVIDREEGGNERLAREGVRLTALLSRSDLERARRGR